VLERHQDKCEAIKSVIRTELRLRPDLPEAERDLRIERAVTSVAGAKAIALRLGNSPAFRSVGSAKTEEERRRLVASLVAAIASIDALHKPAIDTLAKAGARLDILHSMLAGELKLIRAADFRGTPAQGGRSKASFKQPQRALTFTLAEVFYDLTGEYPTGSKKRYGFHAFCDAMFKAMHITAPSTRTVRDACASVNKKYPKKP
jgi:hypothetical protein